MKHVLTAASALCIGSVAWGQAIVIPQNAASTGGSGAYTTILYSQARSHITLIGEAELGGRLPVGSVITGIAWRLASWTSTASWPAGSASFANFDIYLAQAANPPGQINLADIMANLGQDLTQVRSGPAVFAPGYFPGGALSPNHNPFCVPLSLSGNYTYQGGPLAILIRHTGNGSTNGALDWVASSFGPSGAQGASVASYTQNTGWGGGGNGGAIAVELTFTSGPSCYANCDGSTAPPILNVADFGCFLQKFAAGDNYANCDGSTAPPVLNVADFGCFLQQFAAGCR